MLTLKRLTVWFAETFSEALFLGIALVVMFGYDQHAFVKSLGLYVSGIILLSFTTGYLLTTGVARGIWKSRGLWSYSPAATALFLVHSQIFFMVSGGSTRSERLSIQLAGSCVVFVCTLAGSVFLQRWISAASHG